MKEITCSFLFLLLWCGTASAQQWGSYAYAVTGAVDVPRSNLTRWNGNFVYAGGGWEARLAGRFGLAGEAGVLKPTNNPLAITTGLASGTPTYHFLPRSSNHKFDPFVNGGVSVIFTRGAISVPAAHFGGGLNYRVRGHLGLRFEFRSYLWEPEAGPVNLEAFRAGVVFGR